MQHIVTFINILLRAEYQSSMRRQLNSLRKLFDGRTAALGDNLTHSNKGHVVVLRTKSTTDVIEGGEKEETPEITNG